MLPVMPLSHSFACFSRSARTNATTANNISITATSTPSPSAGQVLTYGPSGVATWSNAPAVGGISVAQGTNVILTTNGSVITINSTASGSGGSGVDGSANSNLSYTIGTEATNFAISVTNSAGVTNWINIRQPASANLTNWSLIATGEMANVVSVTWLTNWAGAISNAVYAGTNDAYTYARTMTSGLPAFIVGVSNLAATKQHGSAALTNLSGNVNVATQILAGANITVTSNNAGVYTIATSGGVGEANTASTLGLGWPLTAGKSLVDLQFNSISNGTGLASASNANIVTLSADWAQVASTTNAAGVSNFVVGVSNRLNSFSLALTNRADTNYVLVNNASNFLVAVSNRLDLFTTALTNHGSAVLQSATNFATTAAATASNGAVAFTMTASNSLQGGINQRQWGTTNLTNFSATATVDGSGNTTLGGTLALTNIAEPGEIIIRSSNQIGAIGFTVPGPFRATNVLSFSITNAQADQVLKILSVSGNVITVTNGTGGGEVSTAQLLVVSNQSVTASNALQTASSNNVRVAAGSGVTVTPAGSAGVMTYTVAVAGSVVADVETNIIISSTNNALLDLGAANIFRLTLLTNWSEAWTNFTKITNWANQRARILYQQPTNGGAILNNRTLVSGVVQMPTNQLAQPTTNANALDMLEITPSFFRSNAMAFWPQDFHVRIGFTNSLATGGGGGGDNFAIPTDITNLLYWFPAQQYTNFTDGATVNAITNAAGVGLYYFFDYGSGFLVTNNYQNGYSAVYSDGSSGNALVNYAAADTYSDYAYWVVLKLIGNQDTYDNLLGHAGSQFLVTNNTYIGAHFDNSGLVYGSADAGTSRVVQFGVLRTGTELITFMDATPIQTNTVSASAMSGYMGIFGHGFTGLNNTKGMYLDGGVYSNTVTHTNVMRLLQGNTNKFNLHP